MERIKEMFRGMTVERLKATKTQIIKRRDGGLNLLTLIDLEIARRERFEQVNLTPIVSKIVRINRIENAGYDDILIWHAPSECLSIVADRAVKEIDAVLEEAGMTEEELVEAIKYRLGGRWGNGYFSFLYL